MAELVEIELSTNRFESEILTEAIIAEGHEVELVHDESSGGVGIPTTPSRLLVRSSDANEIRSIVNRSFALDTAEASAPRASKISNKARIVAWLLLMAMVGIPVLLSLTGWIAS